MNRRLLLLSNSRDPEGGFLLYPQRQIRAFLGARVRSVLFVPFASVSVPWGEYAERVRAPFADMGYEVSSLYDAPDLLQAVRQAEAIVIGGGNTFHLLSHLYHSGVIEIIRERVRAGTPYVGWSAGSVVACPTIRTTNDMPIVEPPGPAALGLVPFQINAHYSEYRPEGFQGETRSERIAEFLVLNPGLRVVGLPEGTMLQVERDRIALLGDRSARLFESGREPRDIAPGEPLDFLLERTVASGPSGAPELP